MKPHSALMDHNGFIPLMHRIEATIEALGKQIGDVRPADISVIDEFHVGGRQAVSRLVDMIAVKPGMRILDIGAGLGGPARQLTASTDCCVIGLEPSTDYCDIGNRITRWFNLEEQVTLVPVSLTEPGSWYGARFDACWSYYSAMQSSNKPLLFRRIARSLKSGARFMCYGFLSTTGRGVDLPLPWACRDFDNRITTADRVMSTMTDAGFTKVIVEDDTPFAIAMLREITSSIMAGNPASFGQQMIFGPDFGRTLRALLADLEAGRIQSALISSFRASSGNCNEAKVAGDLAEALV